MLKVTFAVLLVGLTELPAARSLPQPAQVPPRCLHGPSEQPDQRSRREQALKVADEINIAEHAGPQIRPAQPPNYRPLDELLNVPPTPAGFRLQFTTDGATYAFSLKDTRDPCLYAVFSDQERWIYEAVPRMGVRVRPVETP
jgi:hypothetical protein